MSPDVRHDATLSGYRSPRRIRGHDGSAAYRPDESSISSIPGYDRLAKLSAERRLEILGTMLLHVESVSAAWRRLRDAKSNRIGFAGVTDHSLTTDRKGRKRLPRAITLSEVVAKVDGGNVEVPSVSLADSIVIHLDRLSAGFGSMLLTTDSVTIAAKLCGISKSTAYRHIETLRDSWENSGVAAG